MKKKIVYISRLFSGFQESINQSYWKPSGATTIFKFFEFAKDKYNLEVFFTHRNENIDNFKIEKKKIKNFVQNSWVVYFPKKKIFFLEEINNIIRNSILFFKILRRKPKIIYATNQNLILASLFKIFTNIPVVLRVMGIFDVMREKKIFKDRIFQLFYKVNFNLVVITEDGSGTEEWSKKYLNKNTKKLILINGVDNIKKISNKTKYKSDVLFVGRLEDGKGIIKFIKNIIFLNKKEEIKVIIIGSGPRKEITEKLLKKNNINYKILENVHHKLIFNYYRNTKIYVSLNSRGNISNTNLEAFNSLCIMLLPTFKKPLSEIIDKSTKIIFDKESVFYFNFHKKYDLANKIYYILNNFKIANQRKKILKNKKRFFIKNWSERIKEELNEVDLLK